MILNNLQIQLHKIKLKLIINVKIIKIKFRIKKRT